jgi:hypothetical protein
MSNDLSIYTDSDYLSKHLPDEIELFIINIREKMKNSKFRKALEEIKNAENKFTETPNKWKIYDLKIRCMNKIINRKFTKYSATKNKSIEIWLRRVDIEIDRWYINISFFLPITKETEKDIVTQYELVILHLLEQAYNYALLSRNEKQIPDCTAFLALGERIIKNTIEKISNSDCFNIAEKILLFTSSLLIADNDFDLAKIYLSNILKLCFRELYSRVDIETGINYKELNPLQLHYLEKIFVNIAIGFYQLGVCEENMGNIETAVEAYKQAKWFSHNFIKDSVPELIGFLTDLEKRALSYHEVIRNLNKRVMSAGVDDCKKDKKKKPYLCHDEEINEKFESTLKFIDQIKFNEIDEGLLSKKNEGVRKMLSTVTLLDNLSSEKFKQIVTTLEKLEITRLEKDTKEKIQKKVNEINNERIYRESLMRKSVNKAKSFIDPMSVRSTTEGNYCKTTIDEESSDDTHEVNETCNRLMTIQNQTISKSRDEVGSVTRYKYSPYTFNKGYMKKINYIDSLTQREYKFQKKVLTLKRMEKLHVEDLDTHKVKKDSENKFNKMLKAKTKIIEEENNDKKKEILNEDKFKIDSKKEKLEQRVLKSLSTKVYSKLEGLSKKPKPLSFISKSRMVSMARKVPDFRTFTQHNNEKIERLNQELNRLKNLEANIKKNMY